MSLERITAADSRELDLPRFFLRAVPLAARAADPLLKDAKSILEVARNVRSSRPSRPDLFGDERPVLGPHQEEGLAPLGVLTGYRDAPHLLESRSWTRRILQGTRDPARSLTK